MKQEDLVAVLIDADNASPKTIGNVLEEAARHGRVTIRRVYGDFTAPQSSSWKRAVNEHSIIPIQQFAYTTGKNSTDSALIIDAMDLLHRRAVGVFCFVSSDSDFTRLAARIREEGIIAIGFGKKTTPEAFVSACDRFVFVENLKTEADEPQPAAGTPTETDGPPNESDSDRKERDKYSRKTLRGILLKAFDLAETPEGYAYLSDVGNRITRLLPSFDPRNYGCKSRKLRYAFEEDPIFSVEGHPEYENVPIIRKKTP